MTPVRKEGDVEAVMEGAVGASRNALGPPRLPAASRS